MRCDKLGTARIDIAMGATSAAAVDTVPADSMGDPLPGEPTASAERKSAASTVALRDASVAFSLEGLDGPLISIMALPILLDAGDEEPAAAAADARAAAAALAATYADEDDDDGDVALLALLLEGLSTRHEEPDAGEMCRSGLRMSGDDRDRDMSRSDSGSGAGSRDRTRNDTSELDRRLMKEHSTSITPVASGTHRSRIHQISQVQHMQVSTCRHPHVPASAMPTVLSEVIRQALVQDRPVQIQHLQ